MDRINYEKKITIRSRISQYPPVGTFGHTLTDSHPKAVRNVKEFHKLLKLR